MARRSARLSSRETSTPQRASLSSDGVHAPQTVPARLTVLKEMDEIPGSFPSSASLHVMPKDASNSVVKTPSKTTPIKPTAQEMHPQHHQQSTAKPLDEARHLGFSRMGAHTAPPKQNSALAVLQATPSKSSGFGNEIRSPSFPFTFRREHSLELSPEAKKLMSEKRIEAEKIRQQMIADGEALEPVDTILERRIAVPKSQKGRYSQAHQSQFDKMDSIAGHASAFRADPNRTTPRASVTRDSLKLPQTQSAPRSLKRSPSKAGLDEAETSPSRPTPHLTVKTLGSTARHPSARSPHPKRSGENVLERSLSTKRVRLAESDDVSSAQRSARDRREETPVTPSANKLAKAPSSTLRGRSFATPTRASQLHSSRMKPMTTSKIPLPPSTLPTHKTTQDQIKPLEPQSPLLARSPAKMSLATKTDTAPAQNVGYASPMLGRTPVKAGIFQKVTAANINTQGKNSNSTPFLSRTPAKLTSPKKTVQEHAATSRQAADFVPLLAQSPLKIGNGNVEEVQTSQETGGSIPFLARSPSKFHMSNLNCDTEAADLSGSLGQSRTPSRPNLLQRSPMKSILRSPQRLYSDDPAKVAAGTHFATPTRQNTAMNPNHSCAMSNTVQKRVDFSSSTKPGQESVSGKSGSSKTKGSAAKADSASVVEYPTLPTELELMPPSPSPQKRRLTGGPRDFTFRVGDHDIVFGPSPNAPKSAERSRPPTIRHISSELTAAPTPVTGSKKRKFDFENTAAAAEEMHGDISDKENAPAAANADGEGGRPTKRSKLFSVEAKAKPIRAAATTQKPASRVPTLGVKPRKEVKDAKKRSTTAISSSRLNALAQPKRRA